MPLSGSQLAYKQARSGIARSGATRSGYYTPNLVVLINGTDRSSLVEWGSVRIEQTLNDEPDTATFTLSPSAGLVPTVNQAVVIGLGTSVNREFAGTILRTTVRYVKGITNPWIDVECIDWQRLFDRRLVPTYYVSQAADDIARAVVASYTSGFTTNNIQSGLATIEFLACTMATPSAVLKDLATRIGGGFYVDADRDVHLFGSGGETTTRAGTAPVTLTKTLGTLRSFSYVNDASQQRNRVYAETKGAQTTADVAIGQQAIPVADGSAFLGSGGTALIEEYGTFQYGTTWTQATGTTTSSTAAVGATSLAVTDSAQIAGIGFFPGWLLIGGRQSIYYTGGSAGTVTGIPASGAGSITSAVASGEAVTNVPFITSLIGGSNAITRAIPSGTYVATIVESDNTSAQTTLASSEGGDGIHEYHHPDRRVSVDNGDALGQPDLDNFSNPLVAAQWETEDLNAKPGRPQAINFTGTGGLSTTLVITRAEVTFPKKNFIPTRRCEASTVKLPTSIDVLMQEQQ